MKFFWIFLFITATLVSFVNSSALYCLKHRGSVHNLGSCSTSKTRAFSVASLSSNATDNKSNVNKMTFDLTCHSDSVTCEGVSQTLSKATEMISSVFQFESPLIINASFINFCQEFNNCLIDDKQSIGQAYPSISYIMVDTTDNVTRMYPQPLLKQFIDLKVKPNWAPYDISAQFNTEVNWYFVNDPNDINSKQTDFLANVLHELMHGLGFVTSWSDDLYRGLAPLFEQELDRFITPVLLASTAFEHLLVGYDTPQPFWGFVEFPLDKLLYFKAESLNGTYPFTFATKLLNAFWDSNVLFKSIIDLANSWYNSHAFDHATKIYTKSVTELDVLAIIENEPVILLETSVNPYSTGSSLCHVDQERYVNSPEYLMVYVANMGIGISELNNLYPNGPIGPNLRKIMSALGYNIINQKTSIRPILKYWTPPRGLVGTSSNPNPSLTVDLNGPARSPLSSSASPSSATNLVSNNASSSNHCLTIISTMITIISFIIITFVSSSLIL